MHGMLIMPYSRNLAIRLSDYYSPLNVWQAEQPSGQGQVLGPRVGKRRAANLLITIHPFENCSGL